MQTARLERLETGNQGTFGKMYAGSTCFFSGELPWRDNKSNVSCFPAGKYFGVWTWSPHLKRFAYTIVPIGGREGIRIHPANLMGDAAIGYKSQLNGCVALGEKLGWMEKQKAVLVSRPAVAKFEKILERKKFILEVTQAWE